MNTRLITAVFIAAALYLSGGFTHIAGAEDGVTFIPKESEIVSAATGKSISVKSTCPSGKRLIGGGGECTGYLNTLGSAALTINAPRPDEGAWLVECTNLNRNPGEIRAMAWAVCADAGVLEKNR